MKVDKRSLNYALSIPAHRSLPLRESLDVKSRHPSFHPCWHALCALRVHFANALRTCSFTVLRSQKSLAANTMTVQANRVPFFLAAFGVLLLIATLFHQFNGVPESWKASFGSSNKFHGQSRYVVQSRTSGQMLRMMRSSSSSTASRPSIYDIALSYGTDKVRNREICKRPRRALSEETPR